MQFHKFKIFLISIIFLSISFESISRVLNQEIVWNDDESGYFSIENNELILISTKGKKNQIIISNDNLYEKSLQKHIQLKAFSFSANKENVLLFTNTKRVWRYETKGDYWIFNLTSKALKKIGKNLKSRSLMFAKFSPDNQNVGYVSENNLYIENIITNEISKLTNRNNTRKLINGTFDWVYEEEFGCRDGFLFNQSGDKIAFWQIDANKVKDFYMINTTDSIYSFTIPVEYPKVGENLSPARIGVINIIDKKTTWMKIPGKSDEFYLPRMTWGPKNNELYIQQLNRKQNHSKLFISNAITGNSQLLMEEKDEAWVDVGNSWPYQTQAGWKFINNGTEFLYTTEKDGWSHIYKFNIASKKEDLITKGEYDVIKALSYDKKNKEIYFIASPINPTQRFLYKTSINGNGKLEKVTPDILEGSHNYQMSTKSNYAFHSFSNYFTKPMSALISLPKHKPINKEDDMIDKYDPSAKNSSNMEFFQITTVDNVTMEGWVVKPTDMDPNKKYPVLFYFYSEPAGQTGVDRYGAGSNGLYNGNLSEDGYVYVTFDGRGTPSPKGRAWRKAIYRGIGKVNVRDMGMGALAVFKKYDFIDTSRVAVHGWSGGGSATLNCLFQYPDIFHTGISIAAVANQLTYDNIYQERYMGDPKETYQDFVNGSPITHAKNLKGNLLYMHGTADDNVHYQNAEMLINELIKHKKVFYMMPYPNRSHGISEGNARPHVALMFTDFLRKYCPPGGN